MIRRLLRAIRPTTRHPRYVPDRVWYGPAAEFHPSRLVTG